MLFFFSARLFFSSSPFSPSYLFRFSSSSLLCSTQFGPRSRPAPNPNLIPRTLLLWSAWLGYQEKVPKGPPNTDGPPPSCTPIYAQAPVVLLRCLPLIRSVHRGIFYPPWLQYSFSFHFLNNKKIRDRGQILKENSVFPITRHRTTPFPTNPDRATKPWRRRAVTPSG